MERGAELQCVLVDVSRSEVPTDVAGVVMLLHFLIAVYISGRVDERIQRLQFLWTQEVKIEFSVFQRPHTASVWHNVVC